MHSLQSSGHSLPVSNQLHVGSRHQRQSDRRRVHRRKRRETKQSPGQLHKRLMLELSRMERRVDGQARFK